MTHLRAVGVLLLCAAAVSATDLRTLSGPAYNKCEVLSISEKEAKIRAADGKEVTIPFADLLAVDLDLNAKPTPENLPYLQLKLIDGTQLKCQGFAFKGKSVEVRLFSGLAVQFPANAIEYLLCEAQDQKNRQEFFKALADHRAKDGTDDVIRMMNVEGTTVLTFNGFVGDADEKGENITCKILDTDRKIALARVRGIIYTRRPVEGAPTPIAKLADNFQNTFHLHKIASTADGYKISTPGGLDIELPRPLLRSFDFSMGKIAYLSDLDPLLVKETPLITDYWRYRRDKNLEGGPIRLDRKAYAKGLALHSRTVLEYEVRGYNVFYCVLGIDDLVTTASQAEVSFVAVTGGQEKVLYSQTVKSKDKPKELNLNITGVTRLRITVDYGDDLDLGDHVDLADAKVTK